MAQELISEDEAIRRYLNTPRRKPFGILTPEQEQANGDAFESYVPRAEEVEASKPPPRPNC
jgi:hypothetical protein